MQNCHAMKEKKFGSASELPHMLTMHVTRMQEHRLTSSAMRSAALSNVQSASYHVIVNCPMLQQRHSFSLQARQQRDRAPYMLGHALSVTLWSSSCASRCCQKLAKQLRLPSSSAEQLPRQLLPLSLQLVSRKLAVPSQVRECLRKPWYS